jgi:hypothetical protein
MAGGVAHGVSHEFKPQHHKKKKKSSLAGKQDERNIIFWMFLFPIIAMTVLDTESVH